MLFDATGKGDAKSVSWLIFALTGFGPDRAQAQIAKDYG